MLSVSDESPAWQLAGIRRATRKVVADMVKAVWFKPQAATSNVPNGSKQPASGICPAGEPINDELKEHVLSASDWPYREAAQALHDWTERFNEEFRLGLETPAIAIDTMPRTTLHTTQNSARAMRG